MIPISDNIDGAKIFIWAQIGEKLREIDETRILCVAESNPHYTLSALANDEILNAIALLNNGDIDAETMIELLNETNLRDELFRQISKFLQTEPRDLLSVGSFVAGETKSKTAFLDLGGVENES